LVAVTERAVVAASHATTTIPIVSILPDLIGLKVANSLARPGGNATGLTDYAYEELSGKRLSLFKEALPYVTRVALLVVATNQGTIDLYQTAASALGISIHPVKVSSREEFEGAFDRIAEARLEGIMMPPQGLMGQSRALIARR
jgi:putative ABC transport system substrate-binding protein